MKKGNQVDTTNRPNKPRAPRITAGQRREIEEILKRHKITPVPGELSMTRSSAEFVLKLLREVESL